MKPAAFLILPTFRLTALLSLAERLLRLILLHTLRLRPLPLGLWPRLFCPSLFVARLFLATSLFLTRCIVASGIPIPFLILVLLRLRPLSPVSLCGQGYRRRNTH